MHTVATFHWTRTGYRSVFGARAVNIHYAMFERNFSKPFRYVCICDDAQGLRDEGLRPEIETYPIWDDYAEVPNPNGDDSPRCFRRLKLFHEPTARQIGDRIIMLDLDMVICRDVTDVFDRPEPLVLLRTRKPTPFNGSMWLFDAGVRPDLWDDFSPAQIRNWFDVGIRGTDQGWFSWKLRDDPTVASWMMGEGGIYHRPNLTKPGDWRLKDDAKIVLFHGKPDPWDRVARERWPWVRFYYAEELEPMNHPSLHEAELVAAEKKRLLEMQALLPRAGKPSDRPKIKRGQSMLIECMLKRPEPIVVPIGNEKYTFEMDAKGRCVAEVWLKNHIEAFLAVTHLYRPVADEEPAPEPAPLSPKAPAIVTISDDNGTGGKPPSAPESIMALRAEYEKVTGKKPFGGWNGAKLREKIAAHGAQVSD